MLAIAFMLVAIILFILAAIPVGNGRLVPAGLAFMAAALLLGIWPG
jgi:hypothetical protein